jgi:hypothetical protein
VNAESINKALEGLRKGLRQDGADIKVERVSRDCVELSLIFRNHACLECIVESEVLLAKVRMVLGQAFPEISKILLRDPRCDNEGAP